MKLVCESFWPTPPEKWMNWSKADSGDVGWLLGVCQLVGRHSVEMWGVSHDGSCCEFECDGVQYKIRGSTDAWEFPASDVLVCSSYLGLSCFFPRRERARVHILNGELSTLLSGTVEIRKSLATAELVVFRNPHEWRQLRAVGQHKHIWIPWGIRVDEVREKISQTRDVDVLSYTSSHFKRPEFVRKVFAVLRERGLVCHEVGFLPKTEYLELLGRTKVFLHTSISEGWARGIVEAAVAGCTLVNSGPSKGVETQMRFFGGHTVSPFDVEAVARDVESLVRRFPEGRAYEELPPEVDVKRGSDAIARVVDRLLWCLDRGVEFAP